MSKTARHIIAVLILVIPFYLTAILQKVLIDRGNLLAEEFLGYYMLLNIFGVAVVLLPDKTVSDFWENYRLLWCSLNTKKNVEN